MDGLLLASGYTRYTSARNGIGRAFHMVTLNRQVITCGSMEAEEFKRARLYQNKNRRQDWYNPFALQICKPTKEDDARGSGKSFTDWTWPHVRAHPFSIYAK
jgi:hypothetical protein